MTDVGVETKSENDGKSNVSQGRLSPFGITIVEPKCTGETMTAIAADVAVTAIDIAFFNSMQPRGLGQTTTDLIAVLKSTSETNVEKPKGKGGDSGAVMPIGIRITPAAIGILRAAAIPLMIRIMRTGTITDIKTTGVTTF